MDKGNYNLILNILILLIFIFGLFVAYHIIKIILGGSLTIEDVILALVIFNISSMFVIVFNLAKLKSDHSHLAKQFGCLARDFKEFREEVRGKL